MDGYLSLGSETKKSTGLTRGDYSLHEVNGATGKDENRLDGAKSKEGSAGRKK
jgi:hypothetical protein